MFVTRIRGVRIEAPTLEALFQKLAQTTEK